AGLTPPDWQISILDENIAPIDYDGLEKPDVVGITAFTSQSKRAYEIAEGFRKQGVPVVMGGIHATMCREEASRFVDTVVTGEAESVWPLVLDDVKSGLLKNLYEGGRADMEGFVPGRHDLLPRGYAFGAIQTTRGCSLNCPFCSVTEFNGAQYRQRPIPEVVEEFKSIPEARVLIVDDNLIGRKPQHIERAKALFRALADANTGKRWIGQTTINFADDEELIDLAQKAGCIGLFIGFESATPEGLPELGKKSAMLSGRSVSASVERIRRRNILVVGSFIMGLDSDRPGVGKLIADAADAYGVDNMNVLFLTPLPGTRLWRQLQREGRIDMDAFPDDWKYYTLNYPVARYKHLSRDQIIREMNECNGTFYSPSRIASRMGRNLAAGRNPLLTLVSNLTSRRNSILFAKVYENLWQTGADVTEVETPERPFAAMLEMWENASQQMRRFAASVRLQASWFFKEP
ncbi:MAG TPA: radical SAM protein, partial [Thermoleophilia bacterium]|nr:radical SAM protein [Thermoleophilia bacterium]